MAKRYRSSKKGKQHAEARTSPQEAAYNTIPPERIHAACRALGHAKRLRLFGTIHRFHPQPVLLAFIQGAKRRRRLQEEFRFYNGPPLLVFSRRTQKHWKRLREAHLVFARKGPSTRLLGKRHRRHPSYLCGVNREEVARLLVALHLLEPPPPQR
jgi:hypothetical protein